jgi:hypothetical protein
MMVVESEAGRAARCGGSPVSGLSSTVVAAPQVRGGGCRGER